MNLKEECIMPENGHCRYYEWDEDSFEIPDEYIFDDNSDLADVLKVFYSIGGLDFFNVAEPKYYADNWLTFVGSLYESIMEGRYTSKNKQYTIPLSDAQKFELSERGVPEVFITDIK